MSQHKVGVFDGFTKRYKIDRLMYFEAYTDSKLAAIREKQIKKYRREKKIALFAKDNPQWRDLTQEVSQTIGSHPFGEAQRRDFRKKALPADVPDVEGGGTHMAKTS
jgi:predicted GIY-YIG superfamily endonuclease